MTSQIEHTDVGAYALGLLEEEDRRAFEDHLRLCGPCAAELREMAGTAYALADIRDFTDAVEGPEGSDPGTGRGPAAGPAADRPGGGQEDAPPGQVIDLMRRRRQAARRARRGTYVIGAAAATVLLAAGVTVGSALSGSETPEPGQGAHGPAQALVIWGERHSASDGVTGASGVVGLESKGWGTHVGLELRGVRGPLRCRLEAVSTTGERSVVTGWAVPPKGYGVPGSKAPLITHGGTAIPRNQVDRFEVVIEGSGNRLLTIPL